MQERQFSESHSEASAERRALQRVRTGRVQALSAGVGAALLALFVVGCPEPADLQNPESYPRAAPSGGTSAGGGSGTGGSASPCEVDCVNSIFQKEMVTCKLCHGTTSKLGDLDLEAPNYTARLKDQPSKHTGLATGMTAADCPTGDKLIDTAAPANSWLLKKIRAEQGNCGTVMPSAGTLSAAQKTCLETYVACVAGGAVSAGTAGAPGTAGSAGTAGAAAGGGGGASSTGGNGGAGGK